MNLFVLDLDPVAAAQAHCDSHVVKMVLETAQLLSTTVLMTEDALMLGVSPAGRPVHRGVEVYRSTHRNHPCAAWLRESRANYDWATRLGLALLDEYRHRYDKTHASSGVLLHLAAKAPPLPDVGLTPFAQAMPAERRVRDDPVAAYRSYYSIEKSGLLRYRRRPRPSWLP